MKKFITAVLLCLSFSVHAGWQINQNNVIVTSSENFGGKRILGFDVCTNYLTLGDLEYKELKPNMTIPLRIRVDKNLIHTQDSYSYESGEFVFIGTYMPIDFLKELVEGTTLRVQFKDRNDNWSDIIVERYSLLGFTRKAKQAIENCSGNDGNFFDTSDNEDSDYF